MRQLALLGSTGSIGTSCLDVAQALPDRMQVVGLSAHSRWKSLAEQATTHRARWAVVTDLSLRNEIGAGAFPSGTELLFGPEGVARIVTAPEVDTVVTAIVGAAGLEGTWAALEAGKRVCVANKETLVVAGPLVMDLARRRNAELLPVDSEHSAVFQAALAGRRAEIKRVVLTASGGPFRRLSLAELQEVTPVQALAHPTWTMGPKITIDSATMMNKALEIIEARWLFDLRPDQIDVVVHPQSIIHSFVEFLDGSILAQLSPPDMRLPIQYALTYPERCSGPARTLDWKSQMSLEFEPPDLDRFPALRLGFEVARQGGTCGAVLNAANEVAVERFLNGTLRFLDIPRACRAVLEAHHFDPQPSLTELLRLDRWAREELTRWNC